MKYTTEQIETIAAKLRDMPPPDKKKQEHSKQATIKILAKEINVLRKRGYTLEQISETLRGEGLDIATPTLKSYLQRAQVKTATKAMRKTTVKTLKDTLEEASPDADGEASGTTTSRASFEPKPDSVEI